jgi:hypothetical protein
MGIIAGERAGSSDRGGIIGGFENNGWSCNVAALVQDVYAVSPHLATGMNANTLGNIFGDVGHHLLCTDQATRLRFGRAAMPPRRNG